MEEAREPERRDATAGAGEAAEAGVQDAGAPEAEAGTGAAGDPDGLRARIAELERALGEQEALNQRLQADFANFRRRIFQEQREWESRGIARFVRDLLPVLDNLERALAAARQATAPEALALRQGVELTARQFLDVLRSHGIEPVEAAGRPFDPHVHEAFDQVETDAVPDGHVVEELARGFRQGERLIRPALVRVARAPRGGEEVAGPAADAADAPPAGDGGTREAGRDGRGSDG